jgi:hypothetical protein
MALRSISKELNLELVNIELEMGLTKGEWLNIKTNKFSGIEAAVLGKYEIDGWKGYAEEGGLILNLIKSMSFPKIKNRHRAIFIEAIYAQNYAFEEDHFEKSWLLDNIRNADLKRIQKNYRVMASRKPYSWRESGITFTKTTSMLDYFPSLREWMFCELYENLGLDVIYQIAEKFSENPYEYRKGWPDLTIWKEGKVRFLEIKGPGDRLQSSQITNIQEFMKPLGLDYSLVEVRQA